MSDTDTGRPPLNDSAALAQRLGAELHVLRVVATSELGASMHRIDLHSPTLRGFDFRPGQDLMLSVGEFAGHVVRRRYTIGGFDPDTSTVSLHILLHGDGPGATWAATVRVGDTIEAIGPRGKVVRLADPDWLLLIGDETFLPAAVAIAAEAEAADQDAVVVIEVDSTDDVPTGAVPDGVSPTWISRSPLASDPAPLLEALASLQLPAGAGHAYIGGEFHIVAALKGALTAAGLTDDQISAKAYWRQATPNANHGEPPRD